MIVNCLFSVSRLGARHVSKMMGKPVGEYLKKHGISVSQKEIMKAYKGIISRQPDIGGMKNNLTIYSRLLDAAIWE